MKSLEAEIERARSLDVGNLADAIETIGFECTRCGACCTGPETDDGREEHTATVFPDEVRKLRSATDYDHRSDTVAPNSHSDASREWRDIARPMPYGLRDVETSNAESEDAETVDNDAKEGETFEWALQTDACGDCAFYGKADDGTGACTVHADRPLICRTYPFSVALGGTSQPMGEAVDREGLVRAHECEGLGRDISREEAEELAATLKERAVRELEEAIAVRDRYEPANPAPGEVVVHDSEGAKRPDGTPYRRDGS